MRLSKIYTKIGDQGTTLLANGDRMSKNAPRVEAYGTIDELNAFVGHLRDSIVELGNQGDIADQLKLIQNELFDLGGELSLPDHESMGIKLHVIESHVISRLEAEIDGFNTSLKPLENFVLPGGHPVVSATHMARTVCRRCERRVIQLHQQEPLRPEVLQYLNRLSDWLFVLGRCLCQRLNVQELMWQQRK